MLLQNLPANKAGLRLGIAEKSLAGAIKTAVGIECETGERTLDLVRALRLHAEKLIPGLAEGDVQAAQLGLGHAYSRAKVKFNVNRSDNMIIQAIALLDQLDKDVNTFSMRIREWYGWHFPELVKVVPNNQQYAALVKLIGDKSKLSTVSTENDPFFDQMVEITEDEATARSVLDAARTSMGQDISPIDLINILSFSHRVVALYDYRKSLQTYLNEKMSMVAPNLGALIGDVVAARLISHAGSLTNLSKYPASTVQILGAEKALFRALKTKGNTPKYGLIYHVRWHGCHTYHSDGLPEHLHRPRRAEEQGPDLPLPSQQMLHRLAHRLLLRSVALITSGFRPDPISCYAQTPHQPSSAKRSGTRWKSASPFTRRARTRPRTRRPWPRCLPSSRPRR
jgi:nucleolar protein 56